MVLSVGVVTGCASSGPLSVTAPSLSGPVATVCGSLLGGVPDRVGGQSGRTTRSAGSVAAWGSPAIVLRCGVVSPAGLTRSSRCDAVDGVGWFSERVDGAYRFTTIGREAFVEVTVPDEYAPQADALADLAHAVRHSDRVVQPCV